MEKLKSYWTSFTDFLYSIRRFKIAGYYIIIFFVSIVLLGSFALFLMLSLILSIFLLLKHKDGIYTMVAIGNANSGKLDKANKIFKKLIERNTKNATCYAFYGNMLLMENKPEDAIPILEKGLTLKYDAIIHKNLVLALSSSYWAKGDIKKSISLLEDLKAKYEYVNYSVLTTLGYLYLLEDDMDNALINTQKALVDNENSPSALDNMGQIFYKKGDNEKARDYFEKAVYQKENLVDSIYFLGVIALEEDSKDSAIQAKKYFEKALNCNFSIMNTVTEEMVREKLEEATKNISNE